MRLGIPLVITPDEALLETTAGLATVTKDWSAESLALAVPKALQSTPEELKRCVEHAATFTWQRMAGQVRSPRGLPGRPHGEIVIRSAAAGEDDKCHPERRRQNPLDGTDCPA